MDKKIETTAEGKKKLIINRKTIDDLRKAAEAKGQDAPYPGTFSNCPPEIF